MSDRGDKCGYVPNPDGSCGCKAQSVQASCSADSPAKVLYEFERLIERAAGQVVVLIRHGDRIIIRDNSGVSGLTGELLMQKSLALLDELFPSNAASGRPEDRP